MPEELLAAGIIRTAGHRRNKEHSLKDNITGKMDINIEMNAAGTTDIVCGKGILELEGMEFHAFHGCLPHEKSTGNLYTVDFRAVLDMKAAALSDSLEDALDYGKVYEVICREMEVHSDLLEHLAGRIVNALAEAFPELEDFSVRVSKRRPPVRGVAAWSRVTMFHGSAPQPGQATELFTARKRHQQQAASEEGSERGR